MKKLIISLSAVTLSIQGFAQAIGYFNYNASGRTSWANHVVVNQTGELIMAGQMGGSGFGNGMPGIVVANSAGAYTTSRSLATSSVGGEMFCPLIDPSGNIYAGGCYGIIGGENKYIVQYSSGMVQTFARNYGAGTIRFLENDGADVVATGFNTKPCLLKINNTGATIWYKEYTVDGKQGDAYVVHKSGSTYYMAGNINEAGKNRSYVMAVDAATGSVNWCKTYLNSTNATHFTGMSISSTGIILCGATGLEGGGNLMVVKIDFSGNVVWSRMINNCYSWYQKDPNTYNLWGINCAVDIYGAVIVAYEDNPSIGMLAKLNESTGSIMWIKKYGNSGDGFHGIMTSNCTYLATGWLGPSIGNTWDFGLVVTDTSGTAGSGGQCGTAVSRANSTPAITVGTPTVTSVNLATNAVYAGATDVNPGYSHNAVCSGTSTTCTIPLGVKLLTFAGQDNCDNGTNLLHWATETEYSTDYYSLERSSDGANWEEIAQVPASSNLTSNVMNYQYTDASARGKLNYYRLKQTDLNGQEEIVGKTISVERNCSGSDLNFVVYPNPASSLLNLEYTSDGKGTLSVLVYDVLGNTVSLSNELLNDGLNVFSYDVSSMANGVYFIRVSSGTKTTTQKIVKR